MGDDVAVADGPPDGFLREIWLIRSAASQE
jgi:hypothetical protein